MPAVLKGANTTAQMYEDTYLGVLFAFLEKFLLHTTETKSWPGYGGGASAPNATYHPLLRQIRQHFSNNRSARALRDPSSTVVRENRDRVFQLEIVCYSDKALARSVGGLWVGDLTDSHFTDIAWIAIQLARDLDLPLRQSVTWKEGTGSYYGGVRLSDPSYDAYSGILGHVHASGNTHWDPGGFFISRLMAKIAQLLIGEAVPALDQTDLNNIYKVMTNVLSVDPNVFGNMVVNRVVDGVAKQIPSNQELADAKTIGLRTEAKIDVLIAAVAADASNDITIEQIEEALKDVVVDVDVTVSGTTGPEPPSP